jgi:hypothetical protein
MRGTLRKQVRSFDFAQDDNAWTAPLTTVLLGNASAIKDIGDNGGSQRHTIQLRID